MNKLLFGIVFFFILAVILYTMNTENFTDIRNPIIPPTGGGNNPLQPFHRDYEILPPQDDGEIVMTYPDTQATDGFGVGPGLGGSYSNEWEYL